MQTEYLLEYLLVQAQAFQSANAAFQNAADQVGSAMGVYGLSSMAVALLLSFYAARFRLNCRLVHFLSLTLGGIGFLSMFYISDPSQLKWSFALIGVAWASILSMPYALLSSSVDPKKMGVMMGLFNMFIVLPQIAAALGGFLSVPAAAVATIPFIPIDANKNNAIIDLFFIICIPYYSIS